MSRRSEILREKSAKRASGYMYNRLAVQRYGIF